MHPSGEHKHPDISFRAHGFTASQKIWKIEGCTHFCETLSAGQWSNTQHKHLSHCFIGSKLCVILRSLQNEFNSSITGNPTHVQNYDANKNKNFLQYKPPSLKNKTVKKKRWKHWTKCRWAMTSDRRGSAGFTVNQGGPDAGLIVSCCSRVCVCVDAGVRMQV